MKIFRTAAALAACVLALGACGGGDDDGGRRTGSRPTVVVTTSILGDVVRQIVGDHAVVATIMPAGTSPHDFQASAREVDQIRRAEALVVNGAGFEAGLDDVIDGAREDGVAVHEAISAVETLTIGTEEDGHDHGAVDPHFFTDPLRMATAAEGIARFLADAVPALDHPDVRRRVERYVDELRALDEEVASILSAIPEDRRVVVTNHDVYGYFADRYGFEVVGSVVTGGSSDDAVSAGALADLAAVVRRDGVRAIFVDSSSGADLARTLAAEVGDVEVVELFSEALGEAGSGGETYAEMMRTNAERIAAALTAA